MMELCSSDPELKKLRFYCQWAEEKATRGSNSRAQGANSRKNMNHGRPSIGSARGPQQGSTSTTVDKWDKWAQSRKYDIAQFEDLHDPVNTSMLETFDRIPAPCPGDICPLHLILEHAPTHMNEELGALIVSKFMQYDPDFSEPAVFYCPIPKCLVVIYNAMCSTSKEFMGDIFRHVQQHDLAAEENVAPLKEYLLRMKSQRQEPFASSGQDMNIQLYWSLKATGGLQSKGRTTMEVDEEPAPQAPPQTRHMSRRQSSRGVSQAARTTPGRGRPRRH
ncbi:hypothetical protein B0O80DRAFT_11699 [Mortierella sp. GBAus27b]|nr:hypothetical protein B0O80DRAFT_11699 [Mortierella sp. GBAus27b]